MTKFFSSLVVSFYCIFFSSVVFGDQPKQRIVSMNLCVDQLLWRLVDHKRLVSLSYLAADPQWSPIANELTGQYLHHAFAEEIVPLDADLILAGEFDAPDAIALLERLGQPVQRLKTPQSLQDIKQQWIDLGRLTGDSMFANELANQLQNEIEELSALAKRNKLTKVYWYSANGVVIGASTLEDQLLTLAGFHNLAKEQGVVGFSPLDLEVLLSGKPDALILDTVDKSHFSLAQEFLLHPALRNQSIKIIQLPAGFSSCSVDMVKEFKQAVTDYLSQEKVH